MTEVDASRLPYPWAEGVEPIGLMGRSAPFEPIRFPGALAVGTTEVTAPKTTWVSEGVLALYQDFLTLFLDDGRQWRVFYALLASYRLKRGMFFRKLTLRGKNGETVHFRLGEVMAANTEYVLSAKGVPH